MVRSSLVGRLYLAQTSVTDPSVCHLLLHRESGEPIAAIEKEVDEFAAAFLTPATMAPIAISRSTAVGRSGCRPLPASETRLAVGPASRRSRPKRSGSTSAA